MRDSRLDRLADIIVNHSCTLRHGEHILIEAFDAPDDMVEAIIESTRRAGANPHVALRSQRIMRALNEDASEANFRVWADCDLHRMKQMDAYVGLRGADNATEMAGVATAQMQRIGRLYYKPVHQDCRVKQTKWVVLRWPSPSMAQLAKMSTRAFEDFYFSVCSVDYAAMGQAVIPLTKRMKSADRVHIVGPNDTDLRFSIKNIGAVPCTGARNIPDGECFSAPVRDSVEGIIHYNTPTNYQGSSFNNVRLEFEKGRIVKSSCDGDCDKLEAIFNLDEGARYVGEFAIGFNPAILHPMQDILFDEKIAGSFHFTPGQCYEETENGNASQVHWDLVAIQRPDYGGGTIAFDGEIIRKDGIFLPDDLRLLNPPNA
ncbi:MAG: aminopeptidase [Planctomycetota bacterium]|nr:aminopeptidase [Planctomycetota bacterium]